MHRVVARCGNQCPRVPFVNHLHPINFRVPPSHSQTHFNMLDPRQLILCKVKHVVQFEDMLSQSLWHWLSKIKMVGLPKDLRGIQLPLLCHAHKTCLGARFEILLQNEFTIVQVGLKASSNVFFRPQRTILTNFHLQAQDENRPNIHTPICHYRAESLFVPEPIVEYYPLRTGATTLQNEPLS